MLDKLSKREKIIIISAVIIVAAAGYYFYIYEPMLLEIEELVSARSRKKEKVEMAVERAEQLPEIREEHDTLTAKKEEIEAARKSVAELLQEMNTAAGENKVDLVNFNPEEKEDEIEVQVNFRGGYKNLGEVLMDLRNNPNRLEFKNLEMEAGEDREVINVNFSAIHYKK